MPIFKKFAALASTAAAARSYVKRNPDKVNQAAAKAGQFVDRRTKGRYRRQIDTAMQKVSSFTGEQRPGPPAPPTH